MSKVCELSGAKPSVGHNISHSNRKTKRRYVPNLVNRRMVDPVTGKSFKVKISVRTLKTLTKNPGKYAVALKKLAAKRIKK